MPVKWKQFAALCARHRLGPGQGQGFWTAYRPWGFGGIRLKSISIRNGTANDFAVFRALADLVVC